MPLLRAVDGPIRRVRIFAAVVTGLTWALAAAPATAQERFELTPDKTWKKLTAYDPTTPKGELQAVRRLLANGRAKHAQKDATRWIERYPNHPMLAEAYLLRGDALVLRRHYYKALYDYEYLVRRYPASTQFETALEREFKIARLFDAGMRRRLWGMRIIRAYEEAEELYIRIQERAPGSALGEQASLALGEYYFNRAEMTSAAEAYDLFLTNYPRSSRRERAMLQLIRANLATFKGPRFDASGLIEASERLKVYNREFPAAAEQLGAEALLVRIDESLALKALYTGRWYEGRNERVSAMYLYERVVRDHPQTAAARDALRRHKMLAADSTIAAARIAPPSTPRTPDADVQEEGDPAAEGGPAADGAESGTSSPDAEPPADPSKETGP